jgi:hypothetical protein
VNAVFQPAGARGSAAEINSFGRIKNIVDRQQLVLRQGRRSMEQEESENKVKIKAISQGQISYGFRLI